MAPPESSEARIARLERELGEARAALVRLGAADPVTGLATRERLELALREEWMRAARLNRCTEWPLSLLLIELDGDETIIAGGSAAENQAGVSRLAPLVSELAHRPGDLAARFAVGRLALLLTGTSAEAARTMAQVLRQRVEELAPRAAAGGAPRRLQVTLGVATAHPNEQRAPTLLVQGAESALKRAREAGGNRVGWAADAGP